jgi:cell division protein FtsQ
MAVAPRTAPPKAKGSTIAGVKARGIGSLLLFLGLILLTATVSVGSYVWKSDLPVRVADCDGNRIVARESILRAAAVPMDKKIMDVDLGVIRTRVMQNPYFKDASVVRDLPDRILVRVDERVPVAMLIAGKTLYVDAEGMVVPAIRSEYAFDLPVITGAASVQECRPGKKIVHPALREALQIVLASAKLGNSLSRRISEIHVQPNGELVLYTAEFGIPVMFGRGNIVDKLTILEGFWTSVVSSRGGQTLRTVDIRFADQVVARWEPSQSSEVH